ncbi:hemin uptake protein HemP [Pikeienuella sp. HZG-20]|uniref:hemin uptake protein HemP n=1 Tax=Paludibacillus litoralis TaxID=3133267 RepID=UPI0030EB432C
MIDAALTKTGRSDDAPGAPTEPAYDARALTGEAGTAALVLDGKVYTLRITRQGKLLLTK